MNIRKYILIICALSLFAACDHDNEKLVYESDTNNYFSFQIDKLNKELEKTENFLLLPRHSRHAWMRSLMKYEALMGRD